MYGNEIVMHQFILFMYLKKYLFAQYELDGKVHETVYCLLKQSTKAVPK